MNNDDILVRMGKAKEKKHKGGEEVEKREENTPETMSHRLHQKLQPFSKRETYLTTRCGRR